MTDRGGGGGRARNGRTARKHFGIIGWRGWLIAVSVQPGYVWSGPDDTHAAHGSTAPLDLLVPIAFLGPGIRAGRIARAVRTVDIAPTLAALLGIAPTEPLDGVVLPEIVGTREARR